jgi:Cell wall-associated hydrolases (invasion-associated proteins)
MWNVIKFYGLSAQSDFFTPTVRLLCLLLVACLSLAPTQALAKPKTSVKSKSATSSKTVDPKVSARIKNRQKLLAASRLKLAKVPPTPEQKRRDAEKKRLERAENREFLTDQVNWKPGALGRQWPLSQMSESMERSLLKMMKRLKMQLGKPYVWGGTSPKIGFDCSGLVWYAYTTATKRKMPRTANGMYTAKNYKKVRRNKLHKGDLVFFGIHKKDRADHVGVYLGEGKFIEAPRTGLNVRISQLDDGFWQEHYLGSRRVIYD